MDGEENSEEPVGASNGDNKNEDISEPVPGTSKNDAMEVNNAKGPDHDQIKEEREEAVAGVSGLQRTRSATRNLCTKLGQLTNGENNVSKTRRKRPHKRNSLNRSSSDEEMDPETLENSTEASIERQEGNLELNATESDPEPPEAEEMDMWSSPSSSSSSSSHGSLGSTFKATLDTVPDVLLKPKPKHKWFATPEVVSRQLGYSNRLQGSKMFEKRMHGSLHAVQRLELMYKLENHSGCVNALNFNSCGSLLASCSDDLTVCLWEWAYGKCVSSIHTGHKSNVFQARFLPMQGHIFLGTCARDGQVRILELNSDGTLFNCRVAAQHGRASHKLALVPDSPPVFLSCGEDSLVLNVDIRQSKATRLLTVHGENSKIPLYSICCHPLNSNEFMVGGRDPHIHIYDRRRLAHPVLSLRTNATTSGPSHYVTCAVYNHNGSELLATYNDEDIYLWDRQENVTGFVHKYQGHRNSATIKGVNFFGPRSEFIMSGSDCGNIFIWEKETEAIVQWMAGDENGVINCLEPHPTIPVLATSGLDEDAKIWVPSNERDPTFADLKRTVIMNQKDRDEERSGTTHSDIDGQMLWLLWRHINRVTRRMEAPSANNDDDSTQSNQHFPPQSSPEMSSDDEDEMGVSFPYSDCSPS